MRIRLIIGAVITFLGTSFLFAPSTSNAETDPFPISYDTAFSDPLLGLNTSAVNRDQTAAYEIMRLVKCAFREPDTDASDDGYIDPPGFCNGEIRDPNITSKIRIELAGDRMNDVNKGFWDPAAQNKNAENTKGIAGAVDSTPCQSSYNVISPNAEMACEVTLHQALKSLLKNYGGVGRMFYNGYANKADSSKSMKDEIFNGQGGDTMVQCRSGDTKGKGCLGGSNNAAMHVKLFTIAFDEKQVLTGTENEHVTLDQSGKPVKNAVLITSTNLGSRSFDQTFNSSVTVYNDEKLMGHMNDAMQFMADRNPVNKSNSVGGSYYYRPYSGSWPNSASGLFIGSDSYMGNASGPRATRVVFLPTNTLDNDPILGILEQVKPDESCEIRVMHNRFKARRTVIGERIAELGLAGCDIELVAFKDDKSELGQPVHCGLGHPVRICAPVLGSLRKAGDIKVYAAAVHDKVMLIKARFKNGNGEVETVVQSGTASFTHLNITASDEVMTFYWDPEIYEQFKKHWDIMLSRVDTCTASLNTGKLIASTSGIDEYTNKYCKTSKYN